LKVFENRVLRRIFEFKKGEVEGRCRKLHNEELHSVYSSPNIIRVVQIKRLNRAGYAVRVREIEVHAKFWLEGPKGQRLFEGLKHTCVCPEDQQMLFWAVRLVDLKVDTTVWEKPFAPIFRAEVV
jgi:hypothetical protein